MNEMIAWLEEIDQELESLYGDIGISDLNEELLDEVKQMCNNPDKTVDDAVEYIARQEGLKE